MIGTSKKQFFEPPFALVNISILVMGTENRLFIILTDTFIIIAIDYKIYIMYKPLNSDRADTMSS